MPTISRMPTISIRTVILVLLGFYFQEARGFHVTHPVTGFSQISPPLYLSYSCRRLRASSGQAITEMEQDDDDDDERDRHRQKDLPTIFLQNLWKGITLPFPGLRSIVVRPSSNQRNRKMAIGLSFREGMLSLGAYFLVGLVAYTRVLEKWSITDALYFTCTTFLYVLAVAV